MWVVVVLVVGMGLALASSAAAEQGVQEGGNAARTGHWPIEIRGDWVIVIIVSFYVVGRVLWTVGKDCGKKEKGGRGEIRTSELGTTTTAWSRQHLKED